MADGIFGFKVNNTEYDFEDRTKVTHDLLKDTVGWSGKNLLNPDNYNSNSQTVSGITCVNNGDGTFTLNGTATSNSVISITETRFNLDESLKGEWIFSGCPSGGGTDTYSLDTRLGRKEDNSYIRNDRDFGSGVKCILTDEQLTINISIQSGVTVSNLVFKPMLRKADILDDTYEPYHESVETILDNYIGAEVISQSSMPAYIAKNLPIRKKNITNDYYNGSLKSEIAAGNFINVRVGDYIVGRNTGTIYYVVDINYWWHKGDSTGTTNNPGGYTYHITIMPYRLLTTGSMTPLWQGYGNANKSWRVSANDKGRCPWNAAIDVDPTDTGAVGVNSTNITRDGKSAYLGSYVKTYALARYYTEWLCTDFDVADVLKFRNVLTQNINTGKVSSGMPSWDGMTPDWTWVDSYCDLPSEPNLYGAMIFSSSGRDVGVQKEQLALFKQADLFDFYDRMDVWTKAVSSSSTAANLDNSGLAYGINASFAHWVCPLAHIK